MATLAKLLGVCCIFGACCLAVLAVLGFLGAASSTDAYGRASDEAVGVGVIFLAGFGGMALLMATVGVASLVVAETAERGLEDEARRRRNANEAYGTSARV